MYDYRTYKEGGKKLASVKYDKKHRFGEKVTTSDFSFQIDKTARFDAKTSLNQRYYFVFNSLNSSISEFFGLYGIEPINKRLPLLKYR